MKFARMPTEPRRRVDASRYTCRKRPRSRPRARGACLSRVRRVRARRQSNHVRSPQMEKVKKSLARKHANTSERTPPTTTTNSSTFQLSSSERANKFVSEHEQRRRCRRRRNSPGEEELKEAQNSDHSDSALMRLAWSAAARRSRERDWPR